MDLAYVVLTMVDRDDLPDGGAAHVARTVQRIRAHTPSTLVETLVGDFGGQRELIETVVRDGRPDVLAHNVEVVPSLQRKMRDARCSFERSLQVLRDARAAGANVTKSSLMVGCGEREDEVVDTMAALRAAEVDVLTIGQYLRPSEKHAKVVRFVEPAEFDRYRDIGGELGFKFVASGPLVRSSYRAAEAFLRGILQGASAGPSGSASRTAPYSDRYGKRRLEVVS
jgi:lipoic acid synthetase